MLAISVPGRAKSRPVTSPAVQALVRNTSLAFYRALGAAIDDGRDDALHVDAEARRWGGTRLGTPLKRSAALIRASFQRRAAIASHSLSTRAHQQRWTPPFAELVGAGYSRHVEPRDAPWGQRYATLHAPTATQSTSTLNCHRISPCEELDLATWRNKTSLAIGIHHICPCARGS